MSKPVKVIIGVIAVLALGVGVVAVLANTVFGNDSGNSSSSMHDNWTSEFAKDCQKRDVTFTNWPIDPSNLRAIIPMGTMYNDHVDPVEHLYNASTAKGATPSVPVVMPADGWVVAGFNLAGLETNNGGNGPAMDMGIIIQFSCRYFARILHLYSLAPDLAAQLADAPTGGEKSVRIHVGAGQQLGMAGETSDYSLQDLEVDIHSKGFINWQRYVFDASYLHDIDPFSVYSGELRQKLDTLSTRIAPPKAGKFDVDVPNSAQGTFFRVDGYGVVGPKDQPNGPQFWKYSLALAPYWNDPTLSMLSTGHWKSTADASQFFTTDAVDFSKVGVGQTITVGLVDAKSFDKLAVATRSQIAAAPVAGSAVIRVDGGEKLTVELFPGVPPTQVKGFDGNEEHYDRS